MKLPSAPLTVNLLGLMITPAYAAQYTRTELFDPTNFFDEFDFIPEEDPTHGFVDYVDKSTANDDRLAGFASGGIYLGTDAENAASEGRSSTRVKSRKTFTKGLFIADIAHMPVGTGAGGSCGLWPAFWLVGPNWPDTGEIDVVEGVNNQASNMLSLHTGEGCSVSNAGSAASTKLLNPSCDGTAGCGQITDSPNSFGAGFNAVGGGVYALEWTSGAISVWFLPRNHTAVQQLAASNATAADTSSFGQPMATFVDDGCDIDQHFQDNSLVFNIDYCGDWAGQTWQNDPVCSSQGSSCSDYVANHPEAFVDAYWLINSVKVFTEGGGDSGVTKSRRAIPFTA